jgi:hypothetical protein
MKLDGNLFDFLAITFMGKPGMTEVGTNKGEFQFINLFHMIPNHPLGTLCILDEIEFERLMLMEGEIKSLLYPIEQSEAITLHQGRDFAHDLFVHIGNRSKNQIHKCRETG